MLIQNKNNLIMIIICCIYKALFGQIDFQQGCQRLHKLGPRNANAWRWGKMKEIERKVLRWRAWCESERKGRGLWWCWGYEQKGRGWRRLYISSQQFLSGGRRDLVRWRGVLLLLYKVVVHLESVNWHFNMLTLVYNIDRRWLWCLSKPPSRLTASIPLY